MAQLRLSTSDIAAALRGLSEADQAELLELLQAAEAERAAVPVDDREPLDAMLQRAHEEAAAKSGDADAWWAAHKAHEARREFHYSRLEAERGEAQSIGDLIGGVLDALNESIRLATEDGYPPAAEVMKPRAAASQEEREPAPPEVPSRRGILPRDVLADIEATERRRDEYAFFSRLASGEHEDKLLPYRDKSGGSSAEPPSYPDS